MFVLDVLRWADTPDSVLRVLNDHHTVGWRDLWGRWFRKSEVDAALQELIRRGLIERRNLEGYECLRLTPAGEAIWQQWQPPNSAPPSPDQERDHEDQEKDHERGSRKGSGLELT
jgi:hypothetical protein